MNIQISDKSICVSYEQFIRDIAQQVTNIMKPRKVFVSQTKAYQLFGRSNVERWRKAGYIRAIKRPGKIEYRLSDLERVSVENV